MLEVREKSDVAAQMEAAMAEISASCGNDFGKQKKMCHRATTMGRRNKVEQSRVRKGKYWGILERRLAEGAGDGADDNKGAEDAIIEAIQRERKERKVSGPPIAAIAFATSPKHEHYHGGTFPVLTSPSSLSSRTFKEHRKRNGVLWPDWICNLGCDGGYYEGWDDINEEKASPIPNYSSRQSLVASIAN
eukprot:CAMPEP_0172553624 /NCGR_PEP_ID=MMETSP1067-20121228/51313_1 /TAXON_ID=265564 ORGANISM="Thalassiosira punctigera, Strain Tpunct2005C2" /NCGR_SAMPLE_ID=MMETSP1067 /ASSEMBLY_ACC=CAM_ASM_000444 /LENGTH=189 /DNA_ID=CAMNT_0013341839 /DNA_START=145 /DNA_END=714 /DNA_ORIENTATION=-